MFFSHVKVFSPLFLKDCPVFFCFFSHFIQFPLSVFCHWPNLSVIFKATSKSYFCWWRWEDSGTVDCCPFFIVKPFDYALTQALQQPVPSIMIINCWDIKNFEMLFQGKYIKVTDVLVLICLTLLPIFFPIAKICIYSLILTVSFHQECWLSLNLLMISRC